MEIDWNTVKKMEKLGPAESALFFSRKRMSGKLFMGTFLFRRNNKVLQELKQEGF